MNLRTGIVWIVPALASAATVASFFVPRYGWAIGSTLLFANVVWIQRVFRSFQQRLRDQETRHERRSQILSTLAHELRTPLTVIRSSASILDEELSRSGEDIAQLSDQHLRFIRSIHGNAHRLETLTENILAELKMDTWGESLRLRPMDLRREVISVSRNMEPAISARHQRIHYTFPSLVSRALGDPQWIGQVLVNLIHNASKYTDEGGTIDLVVNENENFLVVSVSDNGMGLPRRKRPDLFGEYIQAQPSAMASMEGTGLGLAIVRRVISLHGGEVHVASRPDGGTTVSCTLRKVGNHA